MCSPGRRQISGSQGTRRRYADPRGTVDANLKLSEARANAVRDLFLAAGVDEEALEINAYGKSQSVAADSDGYALERRVRLTLQAQGPAAVAQSGDSGPPSRDHQWSPPRQQACRWAKTSKQAALHDIVQGRSCFRRAARAYDMDAATAEDRRARPPPNGRIRNPSPEKILSGIPRTRVSNQYADGSQQFCCGVWSSTSGKWRIRYTSTSCACCSRAACASNRSVGTGTSSAPATRSSCPPASKGRGKSSNPARSGMRFFEAASSDDT